MLSERRTFGERLKRQRERRGITLEAISESTKISRTLFVGLERGDCSRWPTGLYSRAYVRSYAEAIGLNAEETVEDFAALYSGKVAPDGAEDAVASRRSIGAGALRLSLAEDSDVVPLRIARRVGMAAADLLIPSALAGATYLMLDPGLWIVVGSALSYQAIGRLVSDEPLAWWVYHQARTRRPGEHHVPSPGLAASSEEVTVGDAASTAA